MSSLANATKVVKGKVDEWMLLPLASTTYSMYLPSLRFYSTQKRTNAARRRVSRSDFSAPVVFHFRTSIKPASECKIIPWNSENNWPSGPSPGAADSKFRQIFKIEVSSLSGMSLLNLEFKHSKPDTATFPSREPEYRGHTRNTGFRTKDCARRHEPTPCVSMSSHFLFRRVVFSCPLKNLSFC